MESKKSTVIISAALTVLGVAVFTFLQFRMYRYFHFFDNYPNRELLSIWKGYAITISSGIFTSAFVTFLIARGDYLYERRKSLENMYLESEELQRTFAKIKYIFLDEPKELVRDLLGEIDGNGGHEEQNKNLQEQLKDIEDPDKAKKIHDTFYLQDKHDAEIKFKEYLWDHTKDDIKEIFTTSESKEEYLDKECKKKIEKYNQELDDVMKSYIIFKEVRTKELTAAYGDLDFVFANKSIRQHIFEKLYEKQTKQVNKIKNRIYYFESYFAGNGANKALLFDWVWELQSSLVSEDENAYYRQYLHDIDSEIVQVLIYAYGKVNPEAIPDKKHYFITTKTGWMERMIQSQSEE